MIEGQSVNTSYCAVGRQAVAILKVPSLFCVCFCRILISIFFCKPILKGSSPWMMRNALRQKSAQFLILPSCERPRCTAASPNFAPVYCLMTSEVDGFPIPQAIPLIPLGEAVQGRTDSASRSARTAHAFRVVVHCIRPPEAASAAPAEIANPRRSGRFQSAVVSRRACARLSGFYYLVDAILYLLCQPIETRCMTMKSYPTVARRYSTSPLAVERAIRTAASTNRGRAEHSALLRPVGVESPPHEPPTTCEFVANDADVPADSSGGAEEVNISGD